MAAFEEREQVTVPRMREMVSEAVAAAFDMYAAKPQVAAYTQNQPGGYSDGYGPVPPYHSAPVPSLHLPATLPYQPGPAHGGIYNSTANTYQTRKPMVKVRVNFIRTAEIISFAIFFGKRVMSPKMSTFKRGAELYVR